MASWIEDHRLRCGPLTDAALIFSVKLGVESDPPRGAHGLLALTRAIRAQLRADHEEDERLFVEFAGAYLGLLLCDALGDGRHRKQNGRHGLCFNDHDFFDTFAAIEHALDADDVCATLARQVALAEALARGDTRRTPARDWAEAEARILPRLVGPRFFARLELEGAGDTLCAVPIVGDVRLCFVLRENARARYVRSDEPDRWTQSPARLLGVALTNLARESVNARLLRCDGEHGAFVVAKTGDGLDAARLLLPSLHDVLAPELGSPFAASVPHRDALFACGLESNTLAALRERTGQEAARARHAISAELFLVQPNARLALLPG